GISGTDPFSGPPQISDREKFVEAGERLAPGEPVDDSDEEAGAGRKSRENPADPPRAPESPSGPSAEGNQHDPFAPPHGERGAGEKTGGERPEPGLSGDGREKESAHQQRRRDRPGKRRRAIREGKPGERVEEGRDVRRSLGPSPLTSEDRGHPDAGGRERHGGESGDPGQELRIPRAAED